MTNQISGQPRLQLATNDRIKALLGTVSRWFWRHRTTVRPFGKPVIDRSRLEFVPGNCRWATTKVERADNLRFYKSLGGPTT